MTARKIQATRTLARDSGRSKFGSPMKESRAAIGLLIVAIVLLPSALARFAPASPVLDYGEWRAVTIRFDGAAFHVSADVEAVRGLTGLGFAVLNEEGTVLGGRSEVRGAGPSSLKISRGDVEMAEATDGVGSPDSIHLSSSFLCRACAGTGNVLTVVFWAAGAFDGVWRSNVVGTNMTIDKESRGPEAFLFDVEDFRSQESTMARVGHLGVYQIVDAHVDLTIRGRLLGHYAMADAYPGYGGVEYEMTYAGPFGSASCPCTLASRALGPGNYTFGLSGRAHGLAGAGQAWLFGADFRPVAGTET